MPTLQLTDPGIYYEVHGRGRPMVFLSGTAYDGEVWKIYQVPGFSKDHRTTIAASNSQSMSWGWPRIGGEGRNYTSGEMYR
jgi:hypothetical protein